MELVLLIARLAFLALIYIFVYQVVTALRRELENTPAASSLGPAGVLRVVRGSGLAPGRRLPLEPITTLGREAGNTLVLTDPLVSRHHARLTHQGGVWLVEDLGTHNGTWVDDRPVNGMAISLPAGGRLQVGETVLELANRR